MIASAHLAAGFVAGMASARITERRGLRVATAFAVGLMSHVVLDSVPHGDYGTLPHSTVAWVVLCEIVGICVIGGLIVRNRLTPHWPEYLAAGLAGAVILDAKFLARLVLPARQAMTVERYGDRIHHLFHAAPMRHPGVGTAIEVATTIVLLAILTLFPRTES
jgi:hypothetical protein